MTFWKTVGAVLTAYVIVGIVAVISALAIGMSGLH